MRGGVGMFVGRGRLRFVCFLSFILMVWAVEGLLHHVEGVRIVGLDLRDGLPLDLWIGKIWSFSFPAHYIALFFFPPFLLWLLDFFHFGSLRLTKAIYFLSVCRRITHTDS